MKKVILKTTALGAAIMAINAQAFELNKNPVTSYATITAPTSSMLLQGVEAKKPVVLMNIKLSAQEQSNIFQNIKTSVNMPIESTSALPSHKDLGMSNVPVLDQGMHGSCVTFASTAALDALLNKGDYISQLCNLELGSYLAYYGYAPDGWDGSFGPLVLNQMERFGYVSKTKQKSVSCANVSEYPLNDQFNKGNPMSLKEFKKLSEFNIDKDGEPEWTWSPIMNSIDRFLNNFDTADSTRALIEVKKALNAHQRVTFGTLLFNSDECKGISCATYKKKMDTWSLTKSIKNNPKFQGGHEMVITGYDDTAVATDSDGTPHKGLLILRNSWGTDVGNNGTFYMTYDYFINFATEAQKIIKISQR